MASLPAARFDTAWRFISTGVDMFVPLYVKRFHRTEQCNGLLATRMATRAIHLKVVQSLDTASCINYHGAAAILYKARETISHLFR